MKKIMTKEEKIKKAMHIAHDHAGSTGIIINYVKALEHYPERLLDNMHILDKILDAVKESSNQMDELYKLIKNE